MAYPIKIVLDPPEAGPVRQEKVQRAETPLRTFRFHVRVDNDPFDRGVTWEVAQGGGAVDEQGNFHPPVDYSGKSTILARSVTDPTKFATALIHFLCAKDILDGR